MSYNKDEIIVSTGAKQVIYNLFMASLNPEDEVIIPSPYWASYPDMVKICGGVPVIIETSSDINSKECFKITAKNLSDHITKNTKWLILNSPSNPSGAVYREDELREIAKTLQDHPWVNVMSDDIYEHIIFSDKFYNLISIDSSLKDRVFIVNGVSKAYAMTGWRIGFGSGSSRLIKAMNLIQSQSTSGASSISQEAATLLFPLITIQLSRINYYLEKKETCS
ncbi:MAG TPA: aminotransferase class I/II-fold pyridoxal phosphate-dependent enzyme, partial [Candidatus Megaira endosymbiont of Hartmannula sinica]|nr:aminotransferase class I/II-fold pyridoxal phosphate-dependent enzyme [Candidatus Megaera endosymbiont of Hartmannula sinica]